MVQEAASETISLMAKISDETRLNLFPAMVHRLDAANLDSVVVEHIAQGNESSEAIRYQTNRFFIESWPFLALLLYPTAKRPGYYVLCSKSVIHTPILQN
jgi:hypothetical protein